ncbi:MAG: arylsulfatase [bacterium]|nr:arylsulfatase [bacterium]
MDAPNVVMILLDDLGFAQLGCYGAGIATPNVDLLADEGLRYNSFHVTSLCGPTRASLMTGRNHHAVGMGIGPEVPMGYTGYTGRIPKSAGTLPRLLREAGYSTLAVGKWHLTPRFERNQAGPFGHWPLGLGFERYYGFLGALTDQWTPHLVCDNRFVEPPLNPEEGYHLTEDLASQAIRLMQDQQQAAPGKPFFLYFATAAPHSPHQVPDAWIEPYRGRFDDGWEAMRSRTFLRQKELGVIPPGTTDTGRPSWVAPWEDLPVGERRLYARMMEVYAGFVTHADAQIGRLMEFLAAMGIADNTLVMFLSDNGASADAGPHGMVRRYGQGPRNRDIDSMASHIDDLGGIGVASDYAWGWAWAGNTPFRLWKRYSWLGGVRTPLIVRWPAAIPAGDNRDVRQQFCHAIDLMPTVLEAAGVDSPAVLDGVGQQPLHGESLLPTFREADARIERTPQYFEMLGSRAIYHEGWKATTDHVGSMVAAERELIEGSTDFESDRWSLYNLEEDFSEANDVAEAHPGRLRRLVEFWWYEAGRNQVLPLMDGFWDSNHAAAIEPPPHVGRRRYLYLPGGGPILTSALVSSFRLVADIQILEDRKAAGVICTQRLGMMDYFTDCGWALYFLDGRLVVAFNLQGTPERLVVGEQIPAGTHRLELLHTEGPDVNDHTISLVLNGRDVGAMDLSDNPLGVQFRLGRLLIGRDYGTPVSADYQPPFPFTGHIQRVVCEDLSQPQPQDLREQIILTIEND